MDGLQPCEICNKPAMKYHFYLYPCSHCYHKDCLIDSLLSLFKVKDTLRYNKMIQTLEEIHKWENVSGRKFSEKEERLADYQQKLENLLPVECFFCGDYFIETIYDDMIEDFAEADSWVIN